MDYSQIICITYIVVRQSDGIVPDVTIIVQSKNDETHRQIGNVPAVITSKSAFKLFDSWTYTDWSQNIQFIQRIQKTDTHTVWTYHRVLRIQTSIDPYTHLLITVHQPADLTSECTIMVGITHGV